MATTPTYPGVYLTEVDPVRAGVVGVATAVPVFIGYTESAADPATGDPLGSRPVEICSVADYARYFGGAAPAGFTLWQQIQLFYANGGGNAFIVSVGNDAGAVTASALRAGLAAGAVPGPTMIVIPEACQLGGADYAGVVQAMLTQAGTMQDRVAILDLPDCLTTTDYPGMLAAQAKFWAAIAPVSQYLSYGAAYAPAMLLDDEKTLVAPSGAVAGIWTASDTQRGVWVAPAGTTLPVAGVSDPAYKMNADQQQAFNLPVNGMAIDIIRSMTGYGTVLWGARTLDGNSNDYHYIQVRRTLIYVEQSIKAALQAFVFAANDQQTWVSVTAAVSNFLTQLWMQGGLMGGKAEEAFTVRCGLNQSMTAQDILDGNLIVSIALQMIRPAEYIQLTIMQQMGKVQV